ncbi:LAFA_0D12178g1_1 [Lachancea sp. 'fantastica']|nr:LAFA_0D12178g1_1 [Lachancea sp. 'fantastica']
MRSGSTTAVLGRLPAARYFAYRKVQLDTSLAQSYSFKLRGCTNERTRRFMQTNHSHRVLDNSGPERWSFKFKANPAKTDNTKQTRGQRDQNVSQELKTGSPKWSTYSMPSKETLLKQPEQPDRQIKDVAAKVSSQNEPQRTEQNKKPKRRLRPRKALISLTPNALLHLKLLLNQPQPKLIRVGVKNRGCSGLTYDLEFITEPGKFDEVVEQDGVKVVIDSKALFSIVGSEMDWIDDRLSSRFVFKNPNSKGTCGCGESFMV